MLRAIGLNHGLESAVADLVDNAIDAGALHVHVRFELRGDLLNRIYVVDDGRGMDGPDITRAMTLGRPNTAENRLGHFGVGLKSASFSQASFLTVLSRKSGAEPEGRRLSREGQGEDGFECDVLDTSQVAALLNVPWDGLRLETGTVVRWDGLRAVPAATDPQVTTKFVEDRIERLRHHLGLTFHRLLDREAKAITIGVDVFDADSETAGITRYIEPINPFGYLRSGDPAYPKDLVAPIGDKGVTLSCCIWPGGSDSRLYKLLGRPVDQFQGFYLYRNNRLLSAGSWCGVQQDHRRRSLARVAVDIDGQLDHFSMATEKSSVHMTADLVRAIEAARATDGTTFAEYLEAAEREFRASNQRRHRNIRVAPPGKGIAPRVKLRIEHLAEVDEGISTVDIRWKQLPDAQFIEVDRDDQTLWLNSTYREAILRGEHGGLNDVPLLKAALFLLYHDLFQGMRLGSADKDRMNFWNEVLSTAADLELGRHEY